MEAAGDYPENREVRFFRDRNRWIGIIFGHEPALAVAVDAEAFDGEFAINGSNHHRTFFRSDRAVHDDFISIGYSGVNHGRTSDAEDIGGRAVVEEDVVQIYIDGCVVLGR